MQVDINHLKSLGYYCNKSFITKKCQDNAKKVSQTAIPLIKNQIKACNKVSKIKNRKIPNLLSKQFATKELNKIK